MKLLRYGIAGQEKPGILGPDDSIRDLSGVIPDLTPDNLAPDILDKLRAIDPADLPLVSGSPRLGPCIAGTRNIICVGLNYRDHAEEAGAKLPTEPYLFLKSVHAICGPNDDVILPKDAEKGDWEVELAIIIGKTARNVEQADAIGHVAGYCVINDLSERAYQFEKGGDIAKGKSCDTFAPIGPWLVTPDEIADPQALGMYCEVSGEMMQQASTASMVFDVATLVSYISHHIPLYPGDIIASGTPSGVGMVRDRYLREGDVMRLGLDGLGEQRQNVRRAS